MPKPRSWKEGLYFLYLKLLKVESKKIKDFFTKFNNDNPSIIKQFLRFNYYLASKQRGDRKFTDRLEYLSEELPKLVKEHIRSKILLLDTINEIIIKYEALGSFSLGFLSPSQIDTLGKRISVLGKEITTIGNRLKSIKQEYVKKRDKVVDEYPHYNKITEIIDQDLKDVNKSELDIQKAKYFFGVLCKLVEGNNEKNKEILHIFRKFLKSVNIFMIRDHKSLKRIASRIKYLTPGRKFLLKTFKRILK